MSSAGPSSDQTQASGTLNSKPARVLACALCKQRRVKCDRSFPCENCVRAGAECVQPTVHQRRRRFAERALLDRLHHYEHLLRQNNVAFEPLHGSVPAFASTTPHDFKYDDDGGGDPARRGKDKVIDVWQSIKRVALDDNDDDDSDGNSSSYSYEHADNPVKLEIQGHDHLLFGAPQPDVHLPSMHPNQVQIFRLWQIYLDNVNSLLKISHAPTLQARIIDAASDVEHIGSALEALMFSIYSAAIQSMTDDECLVSFRLSRDHLLARYQIACKQALLKCTPWRSNDGDSLTALYLYLVSVGSQVDPRSLASMAAVAIRIAQRMGMPYESSHNAPGDKALEAEMRRRLWWSLVLFDHRICEIVGQQKSTSLTPIWDCRRPLNVSDFEIRASMKKAPASHDSSATEALFAVVRSELADFVRRGASHLAVIAGKPSTDMTTKSTRDGDELNVFERLIEDKYLKHCNAEVPLHFITIWATRSFFARSRLMEHYLTHASSTPDQLTDSQRTKAISYAIRMVECDTQLRTSPLVGGYLWLVDALYSPILAHLHILSGLAKRPSQEHADQAWSAICDNYDALINGPKHHRTRLIYTIKFSRVTLQAWEAREALRRQQNSPPEPPPRLVMDARTSTLLAQPGLSAASSNNSMTTMFFPPLNLEGGAHPQSSGEGQQNLALPTAPGFSLDLSGQASMDFGIDQFWSDDAFKYP